MPFVALTTAAVAACYTGGSADSIVTYGPQAGDVSAAAFDITGLPCDVAQMLATSCASCHGSTPSGGAPSSFTSYEQLMAPSMTDPTLTVAEVALQRMKSTTKPMPPSGASAADIAVLEGWLAAGTPRGTCTTSVGASLYNGPTVCTSGTYSTVREGSSMMPGTACVACHAQRGEGPTGVGGTVYPTAHEPDNCNGVPRSAAVSVVITDVNGNQIVLPVNAAGNFSSRRAIAGPYTAKVVSGTKTRAMATPQTDGDCNACHTVTGAKNAPGRIVAP